MKQKRTSYKDMLRNRVPKTVDLALKWCKSKNNWVDHVYEHFIHFVADKKIRYEITRTVLGISDYDRNFNFHKTIEWDNIEEDEKEKWEKVEKWVTWFEKNMIYIENSYDILKKKGCTDHAICEYILTKHLGKIPPDTKEELTTYIIKCIKNK